MLKIRNKFFTFNTKNKEQDEKIKNLEEKLVWLEKNRLPIIDKFIQEDNAFNSINQMIENKELEINNQKILNKITEEDFKNSFYAELINFEFLNDTITIDLYMGTKPDYLMGHFINVKITSNFNISVNHAYVLPSLINQAIQRNFRKPWKKDDKILIFPYV